MRVWTVLDAHTSFNGAGREWPNWYVFSIDEGFPILVYGKDHGREFAEWVAEALNQAEQAKERELPERCCQDEDLASK